MHGIPARSENQNIEPFTHLPENPEAAFAIILADIFDNNGRSPIQFARHIERQAASFEIRRLLGGVIGNLHGIYCTHKKSIEQSENNADLPYEMASR